MVVFKCILHCIVQASVKYVAHTHHKHTVLIHKKLQRSLKKAGCASTRSTPASYSPVVSYFVFTASTTCSSRPSIEMVAFIYVCMYLFPRVHSPRQIVSDYGVEKGPLVLEFIVDEHLRYTNFE